MSARLLEDTIASNLGRAICAEAALGSPFALHRLAAALGRLSDTGSSLSIAIGAVYLTEVCRTLFVTRNPRLDYAALQAKDTSSAHSAPDVFTLCARAIAKAVFERKWDGAAALFDLALQQAATFSSPHVRHAVIGLKERYLLLPQSAAGVRETAPANDILWRLNQAEVLFCRGHLVAAQTAVESILAQYPAFGWANLLLIRICFVQADFYRARTILLSSEVGAIGAAEALAWDTLIPGAIPAPTPSRLPRSPLGYSHFRLPPYFQALSALLRGDLHLGLDSLKKAISAGDPASLMADHDPVILFALRSASSDGIVFPSGDPQKTQISSE